MVRHEANILKFMTDKSLHQSPQILPILTQHPRLQPPVVQGHVVVVDIEIVGPNLQPIEFLALDAVTLYIHRSPILNAGSLVGFFKVDPSLVGFNDAV